MVCGHGSRDPDACAEFAGLVGKLATALPEWPVEMGYLEFARPVIREGLDALRARGVDRVLAVPGMLFAAGHVKNDVPSVLNAYAAEHGVDVRMGRDLGIDPRLLQAARDRIGASVERAEGDVPLDETCLVVVGRGTSDSDANGDVAKVARMLWEGMGFAHAEVGYSGVAHPRTEVAVERATRLGFKRIVVFPYFLFTGVLVRRIRGAVDAVAVLHPEVEFLQAGYLGDHPLVVETFADRVRGVLAGDVRMNCSLCKYRVQIIGHEAAVGAPQEGHHHHVEGIGTDEAPDGHHHHHHGDEHHRGHGHSHGHGHGHHHHGDDHGRPNGRA
jgi:sirohydrochlorin cobaltochelatase